MSKYSFMNDYSEGAHPAILQALSQGHSEQHAVYGEDKYCQAAKALIHEKLGSDQAALHFVSGGTQANLIIIAHLLRAHEAVICAQSGHIALHEAGAIEATGHKVITVSKSDGKLNPEDIVNTVRANTLGPHMAKPRLVYISNATELGGIYSRQELEALSQTCREHGLLLMIDGARLAMAMASGDNDISLAEIAGLADVFWFGGTKTGTLLGEVIIFPNKDLGRDFGHMLKQRGALLAKGRVLGLQFQALFTDDLFLKISRHAIELAKKLARAVERNGYGLVSKAQTNQIFPILPHDVITRLEDEFGFYNWGEYDDRHSVIRLVTSWATDPMQVDRFIALLGQKA